MYKLLIDGKIVPVLSLNGNSGYVGTHTAAGPFGEVCLLHYDEGFTLTYIECRVIKSSTIEFLHDMILPRIYIVLSGSSSQFLIEGIALTPKERQYGLLFSSHGNRAIYLPAGQSCLYCIIQFPLSFLKDIIPGYLSLVPFFIHTVTRKRYVSEPLYITEEMEKQLDRIRLIRNTDPMDLKTGLAQVIKPLLHQAFSHLSHNADAGTGEYGKLAQKVLQAAAIIRRDPALPHNIDSLSRQVGLSASSLKRGFQRIYKTSMSEYLIDKRLEAAVGLLLKTEFSEEIIAIRCGYSDSTNLIKSFRRKFDCTPGTIRSV